MTWYQRNRLFSVLIAFGCAIVVLLLLAGCVTDNPCSMATMTAAQIERALVEGCGR